MLGVMVLGVMLRHGVDSPLVLFLFLGNIPGLVPPFDQEHNAWYVYLIAVRRLARNGQLPRGLMASWTMPIDLACCAPRALLTISGMTCCVATSQPHTAIDPCFPDGG
jgi:hypothetical protein